jgi:bifunctional non-homologous end joining protein LigD
MPQMRFGRHLVNITHPEKILFPKDGITKAKFIGYYATIAEIMLPYLKNRPLTMLRYPDGIDKEGFYHKDTPDYFPSWIKRVAISKRTEQGTDHYVVCNNTATLVYIANQNCITPHLWLSRIDKLDYPDKLIFDLDPGKNTTFAFIKKTAWQLKEVLESVGISPFVMTTGSRGLHVTVPLNRRANFTTVRTFAKNIAQIIVQNDPQHLTLESRKEKRGGRLLIDIMRNSFSATSVAPYAIRAKNGAPVATPLLWEELHQPGLRSTSYTIDNIFKRLAAKKDPWHEFTQHAYSLTKAQKLLKSL